MSDNVNNNNAAAAGGEQAGGGAAADNKEGGADNKVVVDPEAEAKAKASKIKEENDNAFILGGPMKKIKKINSFYEPPFEKPDDKFDPDVKRLNELMRRWKVHIFQIEVVNMTKEPIDPFLQIIIGGNYYIDIKKLSGGKLQYTPVGEKGIIYQTDLLNLVEPNENNRFFVTEIISEYRASYFDLMQQHLHVELWDSVGDIFLNRFMGYASIPLIDIANGKFKQGLQIVPVGEDTLKVQVAAVSFTIYFEEIWDFYLTFMDWKTSSIEKEQDPDMQYSPSVEVKLTSQNSIADTVVSPVVKNTKLPHWQILQGGIKYRGTFTELRHEQIQINLWHNQNMGRSLIGSKTIPLKSCLEMNFVKTEMVIHKNRNTNEVKSKRQATVANIQGTLRVGKKPKYAQYGDMDIIAKQEQYLAVQIQRLAVFDSLDEAGGDVTVFATVDWSGTQKKTRGVRRPNVYETLMFHIPVDEEFKRGGDPARIADFLSDELATKSEIIVNVWADTGKSNLENLGSSKVCLREIHFQKFEDKQFTDDRTKQKISYQCRVYTTTTKLQSAFFDTANSAVTLSLWFQPEVPYPGVDLGKLKPKTEDSYPAELEKNIKQPNGAYLSRFNQALQRNFPPEYSIDDRRFDNLYYSDQYRQKHLLPLFLSRLTPPDQNFLTLTAHDFRDEELNEQMISRGIRTFAEVAHFVKCIPFRGNQEYQVDKVWSSPDFVLTMRLGSVEEHALLLASMFRAVKFETFAQVLRSEQKQKKTSKIQEEESATEDRVFVCLGRARYTGQPHAWVMTLSKEFDHVILWEPTSGQQFPLNGRIIDREVPKLKAYLAPGNLTNEEKSEIQKHNYLQRQESKSQIDQLEGTEMEFDKDDDQNPSMRGTKKKTIFAGNHQGNNDYDDENDEDDEESDYMEGIERVVYYDDLDQKYKGPNINYVGKIKALSKERQDHLKDLDYFSDEEPGLTNAVGNRGAKKTPKPNKFLHQQEEDRVARDAQKKDKHLYPKEKFTDFKTGKDEPSNHDRVPYSHVDLIFNHKNIWANLQNHHPSCIEYHLHNNRQWLPLISDPGILNTLISGLQNLIQKESKEIISPTLIESQANGIYLKSFMPFYDPKGMEPPMNNQQVTKQEAYILKEVETAIKQIRSSKNLACKFRKNQSTTYALRLQLDFIEDRDCQRFLDQNDQVLASQFAKNELLKLVPEYYRIAVLPCFFNYTDAERIRTMIVDNAGDFILNRSVAKGPKETTISSNSKKIMFSIGVKIYPFHNNICSVRIAIGRMTQVENKSKNKAAELQQQQKSTEEASQKQKI